MKRDPNENTVVFYLIRINFHFQQINVKRIRRQISVESIDN